MKHFLLTTLLFAFVVKASCQQVHQDTSAHSHLANPDSVLSWLKNGNAEFINGNYDVHGIDSSLRVSISAQQHPKAVVLTCSDSRLPPELIFNKGLGDLFVIRVAGNISDDAVVGTIEYAVGHLHTQLVVVMGHNNCGAIAAAVADLQNEHNEIDNHIRALTDKIEQAITTVNLNEKNLFQKALLSNIIFTVSSLNESRPVLYEAVKKGDVKIVGALYDLSTGKVEWLENKKY
jgi:carbonic anhydrase